MVILSFSYVCVRGQIRNDDESYILDLDGAAIYCHDYSLPGGAYDFCGSDREQFADALRLLWCC